MRKLNEYTGKHIEVEEISTIFRTSDNEVYSVYKDDNGKYYMDAYDAAPSVAEFGFGKDFKNDTEAVKFAQEILDSESRNTDRKKSTIKRR